MATEDCGYFGILFNNKRDVEAIQRIMCHEIHRIRYRLSSAWIPTSEKEALEIELLNLLNIESDINDQL